MPALTVYNELTSLIGYALADVVGAKVNTAADRQFQAVQFKLKELQRREEQETKVM